MMMMLTFVLLRAPGRFSAWLKYYSLSSFASSSIVRDQNENPKLAAPLKASIAILLLRQTIVHA